MAKSKPRAGGDRGKGVLANGHSRRPDDRFVMMSLRLINCPAFKVLTGPARTVLLLLMARYRGDPEDNGNLPFGAREAVDWGIGRSTAAEALAELERLRFLSCTQQSNLIGRVARRWVCSEFPTADHRGHPVPPTFDARRLSQADAKRIAADLVAERRAPRGSPAPRSGCNE